MSIADTSAEAVVEVYDEFGGPILDLFDSGSAFEIPPLGSRVLRSSGTGEIRRGWIQVRTGTASVSGLLTYKQGTTGIEVSVEPAELGDRFRSVRRGVGRRRRRSGDLQAGGGVQHPAPSPRRSGERPVGGGVRLPGELSPIGAHASGMVRRGRDRPGISDGLSGSTFVAGRG